MMTFSQKRIDAIRDVIGDAGQVFFASILIDPIVGKGANTFLIISGLALSIFCWSLIVYITK